MSGARPRLANTPWGLVDQTLSAVTNVALTVAVARGSTPAQFGQFSVVYILYVVVLGTTRTTGTGVLAIDHSSDPLELRAMAARATGYATSVGLCIGLLYLGAGLAIGGSPGRTLAILGAALPLLLLQDAWRGLFFCEGRPQRAALNDGIWAVLFFAGLVLLLQRGSQSPAVLLGTWAGAGAVAAGAGFVQTKVVPRLSWPSRWLREHKGLAGPLAVSELLTQLPAHLTYLAMPVVSTAAALGVVRGAYVFFGPLAVLNAGVALVALPTAVQLREHGGVDEVVRVIGRYLSLGMAAVALLWGTVVVLLPDAAGRAVVGESWANSESSRALLAISLVAEAVLVGQVAALAALRHADSLMRLRAVSAPVTVVLGVVLASRFGSAGAAGGFAIGYWVAAVLAWRRLSAARKLSWISSAAGSGVPAAGASVA